MMSKSRVNIVTCNKEGRAMDDKRYRKHTGHLAPHS